MVRGRDRDRDRGHSRDREDVGIILPTDFKRDEPSRPKNTNPNISLQLRKNK